jgi:hypothetical protein
MAMCVKRCVCVLLAKHIILNVCMFACTHIYIYIYIYNMYVYLYIERGLCAQVGG